MTADDDRRELTLFVSGASDLSARAIADARALCDVHLGGGYELLIVDVHDDPAAVLDNGVVASPTLVRSRPLPLRRFIGDLSKADDVLLKLEIAPDARD
jgi:circadian clock protein KaiB